MIASPTTYAARFIVRRTKRAAPEVDERSVAREGQSVDVREHRAVTRGA